MHPRGLIVHGRRLGGHSLKPETSTPEAPQRRIGRQWSTPAVSIRGNHISASDCLIKNMTTKLLRAKCNDVKLYWKLLRGNSKPNHTSITVDEFAGYFERLGNPTEVYFRPEPEVTDYVWDVSLRDLQITFDLLNVVIEDGEIRAAIKEL